MAAELERSAGRAQARGGMAAAAAFLRRAVELTSEPARRSERALAAAQASLLAGALDAAAGLLTMAAAGPLDELQQARASLLRGQIAFASSMGSDAPALLVKAAQQLEPLDATLARQTYLDAWTAASFAGQFAGAGSLHEVARASRSAPPPVAAPRLGDLLLDGLAVLVTEGRARAAPLLRQAAHVFAEDEITLEEGLRYGWAAPVAAAMVWEEESWHAIVARLLQSLRDAGLATGDTVRRRTAGAHDQLTPQEAQIAQLARAGLSNQEIGAQLFLSTRTVEWHLSKVFTKLGISSRRKLQRALPDRASAGPMA